MLQFCPSFGDRKSYQMDFHNRREGMKEALTDIEEGADIIMIKPAMSYLDMVFRKFTRQKCSDCCLTGKR